MTQENTSQETDPTILLVSDNANQTKTCLDSILRKECFNRVKMWLFVFQTSNEMKLWDPFIKSQPFHCHQMSIYNYATVHFITKAIFSHFQTILSHDPSFVQSPYTRIGLIVYHARTFQCSDFMARIAESSSLPSSKIGLVTLNICSHLNLVHASFRLCPSLVFVCSRDFKHLRHFFDSYLAESNLFPSKIAFFQWVKAHKSQWKGCCFVSSLKSVHLL